MSGSFAHSSKTLKSFQLPEFYLIREKDQLGEIMELKEKLLRE
jgi:hypothetical protein